jgi:hypothetical protein
MSMMRKCEVTSLYCQERHINLPSYHQYVSPRMHPVKRDACVMTNEAEFVDYNH